MLKCISTAQARAKCMSAFWPHRSSSLLNILLLNINIFLLNIIIFLSLDTNFNRLRGTQRMFQLGMFDW